MMSPLPSVRSTYSLIVQQEKQRDVSDSCEAAEVAAMAVRQGQKTKNGSNFSSRKPLHCTHCDTDHHTIETCYQLHGYPLEHRLHKSNKGRGRGNNGGGRSKRNGGTFSANNATTGEVSVQELHSAVPGLSDDQFQQILSIMNGNGTPHNVPKTNVPQAHATGSSSSSSSSIVVLRIILHLRRVYSLIAPRISPYHLFNYLVERKLPSPPLGIYL